MTECYEILDKAVYEFTKEYIKTHSIESLLNELIEDEPSLTGNVIGIYTECGFKSCLISEAEAEGYEVEMDDQEVTGYKKNSTKALKKEILEIAEAEGYEEIIKYLKEE